jgi:hypothetical protein
LFGLPIFLISDFIDKIIHVASHSRCARATVGTTPNGLAMETGIVMSARRIARMTDATIGALQPLFKAGDYLGRIAVSNPSMITRDFIATSKCSKVFLENISRQLPFRAFGRPPPGLRGQFTKLPVAPTS